MPLQVRIVSLEDLNTIHDTFLNVKHFLGMAFGNSPLLQEVGIALDAAKRAIMSKSPNDEPIASPHNISAPVELVSPEADETLPFALPAAEINLIKGVDWKHRSRRNVFMNMGNGRMSLVWRRGVKIPKEEAARQGQTWHYDPCKGCDASGVVAGEGLQTYPCPECKGVREVRIEGL
jgi:hypothetical protein